jgi:hypothetical protein
MTSPYYYVADPQTESQLYEPAKAALVNMARENGGRLLNQSLAPNSYVISNYTEALANSTSGGSAYDPNVAKRLERRRQATYELRKTAVNPTDTNKLSSPVTKQKSQPIIVNNSSSWSNRATPISSSALNQAAGPLAKKRALDNYGGGGGKTSSSVIKFKPPAKIFDGDMSLQNNLIAATSIFSTTVPRSPNVVGGSARLLSSNNASAAADGKIAFRGLFDFLGLGGQPQQTAQSKIKYNVTVENVNKFKSSVENVNAATAKSLIEAAQSNTSNTAQVQTVNVGNVTAGGDFTYGQSSSQKVSTFQTSQLTAKMFNDVVSQLSSKIVNQVKTNLSNTSTADFKAAANGVASTDVFGALLNSQKQNVGAEIESNATFKNTIDNEFNTLEQNITNSIQQSNTFNELKSKIDQRIETNISNINAAGNVNIALTADQTADIVLKAVTDLELVNKIFSAMNSSPIISTSSDVLNESKATASASTSAESSSNLLGIPAGALNTLLVAGGVGLAALVGLKIFSSASAAATADPTNTTATPSTLSSARGASSVAAPADFFGMSGGLDEATSSSISALESACFSGLGAQSTATKARKVHFTLMPIGSDDDADDDDVTVDSSLSPDCQHQAVQAVVIAAAEMPSASSSAPTYCSYSADDSDEMFV